MPATREELFRELDALNITTTTLDHDAVFTVAESEALHGKLPGAHTKNLFLKDAKGRLFLFIAEAHAQIEMKTFHKRIGSARLSFGKPDLLLEVLGVEPGSVTAFALMNDSEQRVQALLDKTLADADTINCHPLRNDATTTIARDDLMTFLTHTGHTPTIIDLAEPLPT